MEIEQSSMPASPERRGFLKGAIYALTSLIAAVIGVPSGLYVLGVPGNRPKSEWADAGSISDLGKGSPQQVTFDRTRVDGWKTETERASAWVILNANGNVTAFSPLCTHLGCAYRWDSSRERFLCPCHGSSFSRTGQVLSGPAPRPLDRLDVKLEGTRLWIGPVRQSGA